MLKVSPRAQRKIHRVHVAKVWNLPCMLNAPELRATLARMGVSRESLAVDLGYAHVTLYRWCAGKTKPSVGDVVRLERYLGLKPRTLLLKVLKDWR